MGSVAEFLMRGVAFQGPENWIHSQKSVTKMDWWTNSSMGQEQQNTLKDIPSGIGM